MRQDSMDKCDEGAEIDCDLAVELGKVDSIWLSEIGAMLGSSVEHDTVDRGMTFEHPCNMSAPVIYSTGNIKLTC
jgi:hypothetical protein